MVFLKIRVTQDLEKQVKEGRLSFNPEEIVPQVIRERLLARIDEAKRGLFRLRDVPPTGLITQTQFDEYLGNLLLWETQLGRITPTKVSLGYLASIKKVGLKQRIRQFY